MSKKQAVKTVESPAPAPVDVAELIREMSPKPKELPRIDGELLYQVQASFYKRDAAQMRANSAVNAANAADAEWQGFLNVVNNKYGVQVGVTHWVDVETGQINEIPKR